MVRSMLALAVCAWMAVPLTAAEPEAVGGFTIRVAELLAADTVKPLAAALFENLPDIKEAARGEVGLATDEIARFSFLECHVGEGKPYERSVPVFTFTPLKPLDQAAVIKATGVVPVAAAGSIAGQPTLSIYDRKGYGFLALSDKQIFSINIYVPRPPARAGTEAPKPSITPDVQAKIAASIAKAVAADAERSAAMAAANELFAGSINVPAMLKDNREFQEGKLPATFRPLRAASEARMGLTLTGTTLTANAKIAFPDAAKAAAAQPAAVKGIALLNAFLEMSKYEREIGDIPELVQLMDVLTASLAQVKPAADGVTIIASTKLEVTPAFVETVKKAFIATRLAATQMQSLNNFKQIGLAMQICNDNTGSLPENIYAKDGKTPLLSWRVQILPYIEQNALYKQFKLDEPWDSENNKKLIPLLPRIYAHPTAKTDVPGGTFTQSFVGERKHKFHPRLVRGEITKLTIQGIPDGASNTILFAEAETAVPWTKPEDAAFDPDGPRPKIGKHWPGGGFLAGFGDGSVRVLPAKLSDEMLKRMIQIDDGQVVTFD